MKQKERERPESASFLHTHFADESTGLWPLPHTGQLPEAASAPLSCPPDLTPGVAVFPTPNESPCGD